MRYTIFYHTREQVKNQFYRALAEAESEAGSRFPNDMELTVAGQTWGNVGRQIDEGVRSHFVNLRKEL